MTVSFIIAIFNHEKFLEESLRSAFSQDYSNIEFIISDDRSSDNSFSLAQKIVDQYPNLNIKLHKNYNNLGVIENFKKNIKISSGSIIVGGSGDDIYSSTRVSEIALVFRNKHRTQAAFSNGIVIDQDGVSLRPIFKKYPKHAKNKFELYYKKCWIHGATAAYSRDICDKLLQLPKSENFQEDAIMSFLSCLEGEIQYLDKPLVFYRLHLENISNPKNFNSFIKVFTNRNRILKDRIKYLIEKRVPQAKILILIYRIVFAKNILLRMIFNQTMLKYYHKLKFEKK